jgi:hypothetical protein
MEKVMHLDSSLKTVSAFTAPEQFESIRQHIDPAWVAEALATTGTATVRKRRLPAEQVVWLVPVRLGEEVQEVPPRCGRN